MLIFVLRTLSRVVFRLKVIRVIFGVTSIDSAMYYVDLFDYNFRTLVVLALAPFKQL